MRKGIKILRIACTVTVLLFVVLPLLLFVALHIAPVQNAVIDRAATLVSERLGTKVSIGRIDVGIFCKVRVRDLYVEDFQRDTLLYIADLDGYLNPFGQGLTFSRAAMRGAYLNLHETPEGVMNIKQVIDKLSNPDKKKKKNPFRLTISRATIRDMRLRIERLKHRNPDYGVDFGDMDIAHMHGFVNEFRMTGPEISTDIETFSAREKSGFMLDHLSGKFFLAGGLIDLRDAVLVTRRSYISLPALHLEGGSWQAYSDFIHNVRIEAEIDNSLVASDDVGFFAPRLKDWGVRIGDLKGRFEGTVARFDVDLNDIRINDSTRLTAKGLVTGLPDIRQTRFNIDLGTLSTTLPAANTLAESITRKPLPAKTVRMLAHAGRIDMNGQFNGSFASFKTRVEINSKLGSLHGDLTMSPHSEHLRQIRGNVSALDFALGELLGKRPLLGKTTFEASIDGVFGTDSMLADVDARVSSLDFKQYRYDSLQFNGRMKDRRFNGIITARDPNLNLDLAGLIDYNDTTPRYDFVMKLRHADLRAMNINRRDSLSQFSGTVTARGSGETLDDMNGQVLFTDATYHYNSRTLKTDSMCLVGRNTDRDKYVELHSDFADATFRSRTSYMTVFEYLGRSLRKYTPTLSRTAEDQTYGRAADSIPNAESTLDIRVKDFDPVADALMPGLKVARDSELRLRFNPAINRLQFNARSNYIEHDKFTILKMNMRASNRGDSLSVYSSFEDLYAGNMLHLPNLTFNGGAKNGSFQIQSSMNDKKRKLSARFGLRAALHKDNPETAPALEIHLLPTHFTMDKMSWQVFAHNIRIDTARTRISNLYIMNRDQDLWMDGVISRQANDSLVVKLRNFELAPFSEIFNLMGYHISGETNGQAVVKGLSGAGGISADIRVDSMKVNRIAVPPLRLTSRWDFTENRAGVVVQNRLLRDTLVRGTYQPDLKRYYARVTIDSLDMGALDPILAGVISSTGGSAAVDLELRGQERDADLSGRILVSDLKTTVDYTQVTYHMPSGEVMVKGNRFRSKDVPVYDSERNRGLLDFELDLRHLSNISYDLRVRPRKLLVLNTNEHDNDFFYGKIYASGTARITGHKGSVDMNINATTDDNSSFFMPLSSKSNISNANYIKFRQPVLIDTVDHIQLKRQALERRRSKKESAVNRMNINMALNVKPNVDLELTLMENTLKGRGEGTFNIQINPSMQLFNMYGDYEITEGSFNLSLRNLLTRKFVVNPGSTIRWTGSPMKADMDIEAIYKLKASLQPLLGDNSDRQSGDRSVPVECIINLKDWLTQPDITFDVRVPAADPETQALIQTQMNTPEMKNKQFLSLLLFKSFMADNNTSSQENIGNSMSYNTGLEFLTNQLNNWLSTSGYDIFINYRSKNEMANDEVDFGLSKSLINNRLLVEVEGNYMLDNKNAVNKSMSNFMGEAYITYLIDRAGTLKLKAFTQTIDRFDENQGLQETGIGIYFKEDFNNFRDLRRRIRERFTNKKRKEARMERRRARQERRRAESGQKGEPQPAPPAEADAPDGQSPKGTHPEQQDKQR